MLLILSDFNSLEIEKVVESIKICLTIWGSSFALLNNLKHDYLQNP